MSVTSTTQQIEPSKSTQETGGPNEKIDMYVQDTISQIQQLDSKKKDLIVALAHKISLIPGVEKQLIARTIIGRFRKFGYKIQKRYLYEVLPLEYKNENLSRAASENNKLRQENGWDAKQGKYFDPKDYDMNLLVTYSKNTLMRIVQYLDQENRALRKQIEALKS